MFIKYAVGQQLAIALKAVQEFFVRTILLPEQLALWNLAVVIATTFMSAKANLVAAINISVAQMLGGRKPKTEVENYRIGAILIELIQQVIFCMLIYFTSSLIWELPESNNILITAILFFCINGWIDIFTGFHESGKAFSRLAYILPLSAIVSLLVFIFTLTNFNTSDASFAFILGIASIFLILLISSFQKQYIKVNIPKSNYLRDLTRKAVSFRISDIWVSMLYTLDLLIGSVVLVPREFALLVTAKVLANFASQGIFALSRLSLVDLGTNIGALVSNDELNRVLNRQFFLVYALLLPIICIFAEPIVRFAIPLLLPEYEDVTTVFPLMLLSVFCGSRALFLRNLWIQRGEWKKIRNSGFVGLLGAIIIIIISSQIMLIELKAWALISFISQIPYALILILFVSSNKGNFKNNMDRLILFIFSITFICSFFWFIHHWFPTEELTLLRILFEIGIGIFLYFLALNIFFLIQGYDLKKMIFQEFYNNEK